MVTTTVFSLTLAAAAWCLALPLQADVTSRGFVAVVTVRRGRGVYLRPADFDPLSGGGLCRIRVADDYMTLRVGSLEPTIFNCNFSDGTVEYRHNGSPLLNEDIIRFNIYSTEGKETKLQTRIIKLEIVEAPFDVIVRNKLHDLEVSEFYQLSDAITTENLRFKYNYYNGASCMISFMKNRQSLPLVGNLIRGEEGRPVEMLRDDCRSFLYSGLHYEHLRPPTPSTDYIPLQVEMHEANDALPRVVERIFLPVNIGNAKPNALPQITTQREINVKVYANAPKIVEPDLLAATDAETLDELLVFTVTEPPSQGHFIHTELVDGRVTSFLQADLMARLIAYEPPPDVTEELTVVTRLAAMDSYFGVSVPVTLTISVQPSSQRAVRLVRNNGLTVMEGRGAVLSPSALYISGGRPAETVLRAKGGLRHGTLKINGKTSSTFTMADVINNHVMYEHNGGDARYDKLMLRIVHRKSKSYLKARLRIEIIPIDNGKPYLLRNRELSCNEGGQVLINEETLSAHDRDSDDDMLTFTIHQQPTHGSVVRKFKPFTKGHRVTTFTQADLRHNIIYYQHKGGGTAGDDVVISVADRADPPNRSLQHQVRVRINAVSDMPPLQVAGTSRHLTVRETQVAAVTSQMLHYENAASRASQIVYTITEQPFFLMTTITIDAGRIIRTENSSLAIKRPATAAIHQFSQQDVDLGRVAYMPPMADIGSIKRHARFIYSVHDHKGNSFLDQAFDLTVLPVNNQVPHLTTSPIRVDEGGSVLIRVNHLTAYDTDTAQEKLVFVLDTEPKYGEILKAGLRMVSGEEFTTEDMEQKRVEYRHDGSELEEDRVTLSVTDGVNKVAKVLVFRINLIHDANPVPLKHLKTSLEVNENDELVLTTANLAATDNDTDDFAINFLVLHAPTNGEILVSGEKRDQFTQGDLWQNRVRYVHTSGEIGMYPKQDSATFAVTDSAAPGYTVIPLLDLNFTILPVNNAPPSVVLGAPLMVAEGGRVPVTFETLSAHDHDSPTTNIRFHLETEPDWGHIENADLGAKVSSFSLQEMQQQKISYVQSRHAGVEPSSDTLEVLVSDGKLRSEAVPVTISIIPENDEHPLLDLKTITVREGGRASLRPYLLLRDGDVPAQALQLFVDQPPRHGSLLLVRDGRDVTQRRDVTQTVLQQVSSEQLAGGYSIVYEHDGSEHLKDEFTLKVTDGAHSDKKTGEIHVTPVNDESPVVTANHGLHVVSGGSAVIARAQLETTDRDDTPARLRYVILRPPEKGQLQYQQQQSKQSQAEENVASWRTLNKGANFTQVDINNGRLRYTHTAEHTELDTDRFIFLVTDSVNVVPEDQFSIIIMDSLTGGSLVAVRNKGLAVRERGQGVITADVLSAADGKTPSTDVRFTVTELPKLGYLLVDGKNLSKYFTQADLVKEKVIYVHDSKKDMQEDTFEFKVETSHNVSRTERFFISVEVVEHEFPTLDTKVPLTVVQRERAVLDSSHLHITDPDTDEDSLLYLISSPPKYGSLSRAGETGVTRFSQKDVNDGIVSYKSDNSDEFDFFYFTVSDSAHEGYLINGTLQSKPLFYNILIQPLVKEPPELVTLKSPDVLEVLDEHRHGFVLSSEHLLVRHPHFSNREIVYTLLTKPKYGYIENISTGKMVKKRFTQFDVDDRRLVYVMQSGTTAGNDSFLFRVEDANRNRLDNQRFTFSWSVLEIAHAQYILCEDVGVVGIKVRRTGALHGVSSVEVKAKGMSASEDSDYRVLSEEPLLFEPGAASATWSISVVNDHKAEGNEKLKVLLKNPNNAILGKISKTRIQIVDFSNGKCVDYLGMLSRHNPHGNNLHPNPLEHSHVPKNNIGYYDDSDGRMSRDEQAGVQVARSEHRGPAYEQIKANGHAQKGEGPVGVLTFDLHHTRDQPSPRGGIFDAVQTNSGRRRKKKPSMFKKDVADKVLPKVTVPTRSPDYMMHAPQSCTSDTQGLLFYDIFSAKMYRCAHGEWKQWSQKQIFEVDYKPVAQPAAILLDQPVPNGGRKRVQAKSKNKQSKPFHCKRGWQLYRNRCYVLVKEKETWIQARQTCALKYGGNLVDIKNGPENAWLWRLARRRPVWIGLHKTPRLSEWHYNIDSVDTLGEFYNWRKGFPRHSRNYSKHCVYMAKGAYWKNCHCSSKRRRFICVRT